jgi:DNA-binding PadR family transcriptional regulator
MCIEGSNRRLPLHWTSLAEGNARRARYYKLTPSGRKQLIAATAKWRRFVEAMGRVLKEA